jgi:hypothetical protein
MAMGREPLATLARRYVPTINIRQSPPAVLPASFFVVGWLAFAAAALGLIRVAPLLARGAYLSFTVVAVVHAYTLGFLATTMAGVLAQWVPVVFDVPPAPTWLTAAQAGALVAGTSAWVAGFWTQDAAWLLAGGVLEALSLTAVAVTAADRVRRSVRRPDTLTVAVALALFGMTVTWVLGGVLAWSLFRAPAAAPRLLPLHIATVLVAWVATLVVGVELKLVPMFAMARTEGIRVAWPLVWLWAGLAVDWARLAPASFSLAAILWGLATATAFVQMARIIGRGQAPWRDGVLACVLTGWGLAFAAAGGDAVGAGPLAVILALTAAGVFITGYQTRILPFIVARALADRLGMPPGATFFWARALGSTTGPLAAAAFGLATAAALATGVLSRQPSWVAAGGWLSLGWIGSHVAHIGGALVRGRRHRPTLSGAPATLGSPPKPS